MTEPNDRETSGSRGLGPGSTPPGAREAAVIVEAATGRIVSWDPLAQEILGYPTATALGSNVEEFVPDRFKDRYRDRVARYRETGRDPLLDSGASLVLPVAPNGGGEFRVELTISRLEGPPPSEPVHGQLLLAVVRDTARRGAEGDQPAEGGEHRHPPGEGAADRAILVVDPDGRIATWDAGAERVFGYRREEIVGEGFSVLLAPEESRHGRTGEELEKVAAEGETGEERRHARKDGSVFRARLTASPLRGPPGEPWYLVVLRDVPAPRNVEERLASHTRLLEHAGDAVLATDERFVLTAWNGGAEEMYGWRAEEVLGRHIGEVLRPDFTDEQTTEALRVLSDTGRYRSESITHRKDGAPLYTESTTVALRGEQGRTIGYLSINRDATERKRAEEALRDALDDVRRQTVQLRRLNDAALAVNAAPTVEEVLQTVTERAKEVVEAHQSAACFATGGDLSRTITATSFSDEYAAWRGLEGPFDGSEIQAFVSRTNRPVRLTRDELDAHPDFRRLGEGSDERPPMRGCLAVPLTGSDGAYVGLVQLSDKREGEFTEADEAVLVQLAQMASDALARTLLYQQTRSAIDSLSAHIAILDETGTILAVNRAWREFAESNAPAGTQSLAEGANYLEVAESATGPNSEEAPGVARALRAIISGELESFELEYPCQTPDERLWFLERVTRFPDTDPARVVVAHENVTERKLAQEETEARTRQQAVVADLGLRALEGDDLRSLMDEAVASVVRTLEVEYCKIVELLPGGDELLLRAGAGWEEGAVGTATEEAGTGSQAGYALRSGGPVISGDLRADPRFESSPLMREHGVVSGATVVISGRDGPFGVLGAHAAGIRSFSDDDVNFLQAVANVLATAVERRESEGKLREVREAERDRMARDLHDEALQDLSRALVETRLIQGISRDRETNDRLERLFEALKRAGQRTRDAIYDLRMDREARERTLVEMLGSIVETNRRSSPGREIDLSVEGDPIPPLPESKQVELLRILNEALLNALRHSDADRVRIAVEASGGRLRADVEDDGAGFDPGRPGAGLGIKGMRERAHAVGGDLRILSRPGEGTRVHLELSIGAVRREPDGSEDVRVLLVEDHASVRQGTASVLEQEAGFRIVGEAGSLAEAREVLGTGRDVDVAVVDLRLPDGYGGDLIRDLREANPGAQALVLSAILDRAEVARAVESGAAGVLDKLSEMGEVVEAIRRLRAGEMLMPLERVVELLRFAGSRREEEFEAHQAIAQLTSRETEVLQALADGLDSGQVADRLNISVKTEANHMTSILSKLGMHSRLQALVFAIRHGVVEVR